MLITFEEYKGVVESDPSTEGLKQLCAEFGIDFEEKLREALDAIVGMASEIEKVVPGYCTRWLTKEGIEHWVSLTPAQQNALMFEEMGTLPKDQVVGVISRTAKRMSPDLPESALKEGASWVYDEIAAGNDLIK